MQRSLCVMLFSPTGIRSIFNALGGGIGFVGHHVNFKNSLEHTSLLLQRSATKKAGGQCKRPNKARYPKNYGVKSYEGELVFPGMAIVVQNGSKFRPGYNVGMGRTHTIFADRVGFVKFHDEELVTKRNPGSRKYVSVIPIGNDWSEGYKEKEKIMIERRAEIKRKMLRHYPKEPALYFPLLRHKQTDRPAVIPKYDQNFKLITGKAAELKK